MKLIKDVICDKYRYNLIFNIPFQLIFTVSKN